MVDRATPALLALTDAATARRPGKGGRRRGAGHLIDSASNNHGRFVRAQLQDDLMFSGYDQVGWVDVQKYQDAPWPELVALWRAFNLHLARIMAAVPETVRLREHRRHTLDEIAWKTVPAGEPATLEYLMQDYVDHLNHHLRQILGERWGVSG